MKVILSVRQGEDGEWRDLELPATRPLAELLPLLLSALGGESKEGWELWAAPPERPLALDQTLAAAGVWDGSWLLLRFT
jgi:hypothetical protein